MCGINVLKTVSKHGRMRPKDLIDSLKPRICKMEYNAKFLKMVELIGKLIKDDAESYIVPKHR